jgi:hypothetical protein
MRYIFLIFLFGCAQKPKPFTATHISEVITQMTEVMIHDITNPPLAARFFAYACLAAQEVISQNDSSIKTMHGRLNDYPALHKPNSNYHVPLSALLAMLYTAQKLQPSGQLLKQYEKQLLDSCQLPDDQIQNSVRYAQAISQSILAYARSDGYNRISNFARYTPVNDPGCWYPTAPAYLAAVEPYFSTVRPFVLDSCSQFRPPPPVAYSTVKQSGFYALMQQNYTAHHQLTNEQKAMAAFWDCNPFAVKNDGHLILSQKKISPGAHWLGIAGIACVQAKKPFAQSVQIVTSVAIGLMDAFICCWQEKYHSNRIRPETAIRRSIDPHWQPLLQTPPFPEYLSGHSVISAASATILSHYFGNNFSYSDSVEVSYGLPARHFSSFQHAAQEAAISRFYGGIHFMDAIENGLVAGDRVGRRVIACLF